MQTDFSALQNNFDSKLDRLAATFLTRVLRTVLKADERLASWLAREASELCTYVDTLIWKWQNRRKKLQAAFNSNRTPQLLCPSTSFCSLFPRGALHFFRLFSHWNARGTHQREPLTEDWTSTFSLQTAKVGVLSSLLSNLVTLKMVRQSVIDIWSMQKRIARDTIFQALHCKQLLSR